MIDKDYEAARDVLRKYVEQKVYMDMADLFVNGSFQIQGTEIYITYGHKVVGTEALIKLTSPAIEPIEEPILGRGFIINGQ